MHAAHRATLIEAQNIYRGTVGKAQRCAVISKHAALAFATDKYQISGGKGSCNLSAKYKVKHVVHSTSEEEVIGLIGRRSD